MGQNEEELRFTIAAPPVREAQVSLGRTAVEPTPDQILWVMIRRRTRAISFERYSEFVNSVMCGEDIDQEQYTTPGASRVERKYRQFLNRPFGLQGYEALKAATEYFLMHEVGIIEDFVLDGVEEMDDEGRLGYQVTDETLQQMRDLYYEELQRNGSRASTLPYIQLILQRFPELPIKDPQDVRTCYGVLPHRLTGPLGLELLWSYWHEEGMLVQTLNAISRRFQNVRSEGQTPDPLARLEIDPLRPLNNILWGYVQDEWTRLSVVRRAYEYQHEYGLSLVGKAVPVMRPADRRSRFLGAFHHLLNLCGQFFREDDDTTIIADGFPLLNALKEIHMILAFGAHNQFGDLPWTARVEMLMQEWILARPEMREFLGGRVMVPYPETWMDRVDSVKSMMGWTDVNVNHFRDLGVFGEQLLLSIRYGSWAEIHTADSASNWARYWRPEIQGYSHAYRAATGIDLTEGVDDTLPAIHLRRRQPGLKAGAGDSALPAARRPRPAEARPPARETM